MIYPLIYPNADCAAHLFAPFIETNLVLASILAGFTPAMIYVDDPHRPSAALTWFKYRLFLAGHPRSSTFIAELADLLDSQLIPAARRSGIDACIVDIANHEWINVLPEIFPGLHPIDAQRQYYSCFTLSTASTPILPADFTLLPVDASLLARGDLNRIAELRDETCSERISVEDFLAHSFGYCIIYNSELVCWCLSEYNTGGRCEVGVATAEPYQRRGLATIATHALLEHAFRSGYTQVGWHCWTRNHPSGALARKAGFTLKQEHIVYLYPSI